VIATNGGFFDTRSGACYGNIFSDGSIVQEARIHRNVNFGLLKDGRWAVGYYDISDWRNNSRVEQVVSGVVLLVREGRNYVQESLQEDDMSVQETGSGFSTILSARTAIGHTADGKLLLLTISGRSYQRGANLMQMAELMISYGAQNAVNLDGGGSATFVQNLAVSNQVSDRCPVPNEREFCCERKITTITCVHDREERTCPANCNGHCSCNDGSCVCDPTFHGFTCKEQEQQERGESSGLMWLVLVALCVSVLGNVALAAQTLSNWCSEGLQGASRRRDGHELVAMELNVADTEIEVEGADCPGSLDSRNPH